MRFTSTVTVAGAVVPDCDVVSQSVFDETVNGTELPVPTVETWMVCDEALCDAPAWLVNVSDVGEILSTGLVVTTSVTGMVVTVPPTEMDRVVVWVPTANVLGFTVKVTVEAAVPGVPEVPLAPDSPDVPDALEVPLVPDVPLVPEIPVSRSPAGAGSAAGSRGSRNAGGTRSSGHARGSAGARGTRSRRSRVFTRPIIPLAGETVSQVVEGFWLTL